MECIYVTVSTRWLSHADVGRTPRHSRMSDKYLTWILMSLQSPSRYFMMMIDIYAIDSINLLAISFLSKNFFPLIFSDLG